MSIGTRMFDMALETSSRTFGISGEIPASACGTRALGQNQSSAQAEMLPAAPPVATSPPRFPSVSCLLLHIRKWRFRTRLPSLEYEPRDVRSKQSGRHMVFQILECFLERAGWDTPACSRQFRRWPAHMWCGNAEMSGDRTACHQSNMHHINQKSDFNS